MCLDGFLMMLEQRWMGVALLCLSSLVEGLGLRCDACEEMMQYYYRLAMLVGGWT